MTILGLTEVTVVNAVLSMVNVGKVPCGAFAGTLNRPAVQQNGEDLALAWDIGNQGGGRN
jgi:hypothetical protein